jgi:predicted nucleic acid-binding protein
MIAVDSSSMIAFIQGDSGPDIGLLEGSIDANELVLPPPVLAELLSDPKLPPGHFALLEALPLLGIEDGYWIRAARTRAKLLARKLRARFADTLIAQSCIDHDVPLIARDGDFRHFARYCGLKLA